MGFFFYILFHICDILLYLTSQEVHENCWRFLPFDFYNFSYGIGFLFQTLASNCIDLEMMNIRRSITKQNAFRSQIFRFFLPKVNRGV